MSFLTSRTDAELAAFTLEEYRSLRQESGLARQAQQAILQWSIAAFAVVFAAALVLPTQEPGAILSGEALVGTIVVFGFALPGAVVGSSLAWFGELYRGERVGYYLRSREAALAKRAADPKNLDESITWTDALAWETFIALPARKNPVLRKQRIGYIGTLGLFEGALLLSLGILVFAVFNHEFAGRDWPWRVGYDSYAGALAAFVLGFHWRLGRHLVNAGSSRPEWPLAHR